MEKETVNMEKGLGTILREEREKRGLTYEQIFEITKLRPKIINALENEEWEKLPPSVFVKGFIRSYAQVLKLDPEELIMLYNKTNHAQQDQVIIRKRPHKKSPVTHIVFAIAIVVIIILAFLTFRKYHSSKLRIKGPVPKNVNKVLTISLKNPVTFPAILEIKTRRRTWLKIAVDKYRPEKYMLEPGEYISWQIREGFELIAGNASGIDLWLNNIPIHFNKKDDHILYLRVYSKRHKRVNKI